MIQFLLMIIFTTLAGLFTISGYIKDNWYLMSFGAVFIIASSVMWFIVY